MALLRLDKYLCDMQLGTRSQIKEMVRKSRVQVNGTFVKKSDVKVNTDCDKVLVDGKEVCYVEYEYYMLNKPAGVLSAARDRNAETVLDLIKDNNRKDLFPVGRLDKDTEGLLLITNDGMLSHELLSPSKHVDKVYFAKVRGRMTEREVKAFADGLVIDEEFTALPGKLVILSYDDINNESLVEVTIHEGKFHQVKRMFEAVNSEVLYLKRLSMGSLKLDETLNTGEYRQLTQDEIDALKICNR